ncbi:MAG: DUF3577 domain-containing protein [Proteobacteria bacterium]|nr:DUF3577 domain-containing protein [Pseudomonadota bacterium]
MTASSNGKTYFDLHTNGLGYLNRVREVKPRKGEPFLACDISALHGPSDDVEYCRFDVKVSGTDAKHLIRRCGNAVKAGRKVLIGFRLGDLWVDQFTYPADCRNPEKAGQPGVSLKARLLFISWIKIDKTLFYKAEPRAERETAHDEPPESEPTGAEAESTPPPESEVATPEVAA